MGDRFSAQRAGTVALLLTLLPALVVGCAPAAPTAPIASPSASGHGSATAEPSAPATLEASAPATEGPSTGTALAALAQLPVRTTDAPGYERDAFGEAWEDVDGNGCDTRNDILVRDLTGEVVDTRCRVLTGVLVSAYTGATVTFVRGRGTSSQVQIDHVVALSDAWRSGANALTSQQREALANDPLNLQAIEGPLNASKGDQDAAEWLPPLASYRCEYVARQVSVKFWYGLSVTLAEQQAMRSVLATCPNQSAPPSPFLSKRLGNPSG
ncbi:MAG TPA: HNH endonuclease family protein [Microbacteriaceae bacterium]|nr:HNH endonuclease family protein [Microbacteriaceae bacterium]